MRESAGDEKSSPLRVRRTGDAFTPAFDIRHGRGKPYLCNPVIPPDIRRADRIAQADMKNKAPYETCRDTSGRNTHLTGKSPGRDHLQLRACRGRWRGRALRLLPLRECLDTREQPTVNPSPGARSKIPCQQGVMAVDLSRRVYYRVSMPGNERGVYQQLMRHTVGG